jgi:hypothetical protein
MKGKLGINTMLGWIVINEEHFHIYPFDIRTEMRYYQIHPDYVKYYFLDEDDKGKEVEFEIVEENVDTGELVTPYKKIKYAKLIKYE